MLKPSPYNLLGARFGKLVITARVKGKWLFLCDCGEVGSGKSSDFTKTPPRSCCTLCVRKLPRKSIKDKGLVLVFNSTRSNARVRGIPFNLTLEQVSALSVQDCEYCGDPPVPRGRHMFASHGIDRVDNTIGYVYTNCVPCCSVCNHMKRDFTKTFMVTHMEKY